MQRPAAVVPRDALDIEDRGRLTRRERDEVDADLGELELALEDGARIALNL